MRKKRLVAFIVISLVTNGFNYADSTPLPSTPPMEIAVDEVVEVVEDVVDEVIPVEVPVVVPDFATLGEYISKEVKSNTNLVITQQKMELGSGFYSAHYSDLNAVAKVRVVSKDMTVQEYTKPDILPQRDIFELDTYTNDIEIKDAGTYVILTYSTSKNNPNLQLKKYTKRTSALHAKDLISWSNSYTDHSVVSVYNNGATYVNMAKYAPEIVSFSQVSTPLNRTHTILDEEDIVIQRKDFADMLIRVNADLMQHGYRLLIYDGYRAKESTKKLLEYTLEDIKKPAHLKEYPEITMANLSWYVVSDKSTRDRHGKGTAADVTLVKMSTGEVVNMPTRVNTMNTQSWIDYTLARSPEYRLLLDAMKKHNVIPYEKEWYHFSYVAPKEIDFPTKGLRASFYPDGDLGLKPAAWSVDSIEVLMEQGAISADDFAYKTAITREVFVSYIIAYVERNTAEITRAESPFKDTTVGSIEKAYTAGIVRGNTQKLFHPNRPITREEVAVVLVNTQKYIEEYHGNKKTIGDIEDTDSADSAIEVDVGTEQGTEQDTEPTTDPPDDATGAVDKTLTVASDSDTGRALTSATVDDSTSVFKDSSSISAWALTSVQHALKYNWLRGTTAGYFKPTAYLTMEEAFVTIANLYKAQTVP